MAKLVLTTVDGLEKARKLSREILERKLAACVSLLNAESHYWWEGKIERADEYVLLIKTINERADALVSFLENNHPYEVPEILVIDLESVSEPYLRWMRDVTLR